MKTLILGIAVAAATIPFAGGCATPAYSGGLPSIKFPEEKPTGENMNNIIRAWAFENRQMIDDINHVLLLEPPSQLTKWNLATY